MIIDIPCNQVNEFETDENKLDWNQQCFQRDVPKFAVHQDIPYPGMFIV